MKKKVMREHMSDRFGKVCHDSLTPPPPASLNIELNNTCNHKCVFCGYHGKHGTHPLKLAIMDTGFAKKILDQARELGIGRKEVGFYMAGEPLLHQDLPEIVAYAKSLGFPYTFLTSNGTPADQKRIEELADAGLDSIRFSVNGGDRETYRKIHGVDQFDRVVENIRHLWEYREKKQLSIGISLSCVVTKKTGDIQQKIKDVFSAYVDDILFIPVMLDRLNAEGMRDEYEMMDDSNSQVIAQIDSDYVCPLLFETMYINCAGGVMPCCRAYDFDCVFADLHENFDLEAAWYSESYKRFRRIFLEGASDQGTICEVCILRKKGIGRLSMDGSDDFTAKD